MDIEREKYRLTKLYRKHGLSFGLHLKPPEEMKIISTKKFFFLPIFLRLRKERLIVFFYVLI